MLEKMGYKIQQHSRCHSPSHPLTQYASRCTKYFAVFPYDSSPEPPNVVHIVVTKSMHNFLLWELAHRIISYLLYIDKSFYKLIYVGIRKDVHFKSAIRATFTNMKVSR